MATSNAVVLPVLQAAELASTGSEPSWLFEGLWLEQGVGVVGGAPKSCKSWLGLDMATSLASATSCLGHFPATRAGRVLLYMAEDAQSIVRLRLEALCAHRGLELAQLPLFVITSDVLRLDKARDQERLEATVARFRPQLLLLDPLVRMHHIDENHAGEVSALLAFLRRLQRCYATAVVLVHHTRKNGSTSQPGVALRGSGDIHAFGDTNLYLRRVRERLMLAFEHRAAPANKPIEIRLCQDDEPHLEVVAEKPSGHGLDEAILELLSQCGPMSRRHLRERLAVRNARLGTALKALDESERVQLTDGRYCLPESSHDSASPL